jgi:uncharacterized SAM-binding protein YcdF (DUF218 family)
VRSLLVPGLLALLVIASVLGTGFILDVPQPDPPPRSDAIIVISGDEQLARFREGVRLYRLGLGRVLVFSGAAQDGQRSNANVMYGMAVDAGVPPSAIIEEPLGEDTWGNAVHTRRALEEHGITSAVLVTSPYHLRRARVTFDAAYRGSGITLSAHAAPDSQWRKLSWWQSAETRRLTISELQKLAYIAATGRYD